MMTEISVIDFTAMGSEFREQKPVSGKAAPLFASEFSRFSDKLEVTLNVRYRRSTASQVNT